MEEYLEGEFTTLKRENNRPRQTMQDTRYISLRKHWGVDFRFFEQPNLLQDATAMAAAGIPTVTVFGPGDPQRYHPWHPQARWISSSSGHLKDINTNEVAAEVLTLLDQGISR